MSWLALVRHHWLVQITSHELTAGASVLSAAVAIVAIVSGNRVASRANRNALEIAREERASKRQDELNALKRATYVRTLSALSALSAASMEDANIGAAWAAGKAISPGIRIETARKRINAVQVAYDSVADLELVSNSARLRDLAIETLNGAMVSHNGNQTAYIRGGIKLRVALQYDLHGKEMPGPEDMDRMVDISLPKVNWDEQANVPRQGGSPGQETQPSRATS